MLKKRLSVVVPAFNEEENIAKVVERVHKIAPNYCTDYEILIVNDKSSDNTGKIINSIAKKDKKVKTIHNKINLGFGGSYLKGLRNANFEYVMLIVGDNTNPLYSLKKVISQIGKADIIIPYYINFHTTKTWLRHVVSISYTHLVNNITGLSLKYYNGIALHRTDLVKPIPNLSTGFGFNAEILVYLIKRGATYIEVPVINEDEKSSTSSAFKIKNIVKVIQSIHKLSRLLHVVLVLTVGVN